MRYIAAVDIARAKEMDLLTYLRYYEPQELVHVSGNTYCTREHDSLRISNGKWCWFSQGIGGRSALDYLIKVKGIPFTQAAEIILGREAEKPPVFYRQKERKHTNLLMPELSETTDRVEKYLQGRGIHPVIIRYCLDNKLLFESADYHNAMFVGYRDQYSLSGRSELLRTSMLLRIRSLLPFPRMHFQWSILLALLSQLLEMRTKATPEIHASEYSHP